ncbi:MAG: hypothetical protein Q7Q73_05650 [Verrucomicrobiota bacterium JB024]|nr:hypothetical protein [Verrucomicrobiota bacterium JB024]
MAERGALELVLGRSAFGFYLYFGSGTQGRLPCGKTGSFLAFHRASTRLLSTTWTRTILDGFEFETLLFFRASHAWILGNIMVNRKLIFYYKFHI